MIDDREKAKRFRRARREQLRRSILIQTDTFNEILNWLDRARIRIMAALAGVPSEFESWRLGHLQTEVRRAMETFSASATGTLLSGLDQSWAAGSDLIVEPGAGGRVLDVLEAEPPLAFNVDNQMRKLLLDLLKQHRPAFLEGRDVDAISDADLGAALSATLAEAARTDPPRAEPQPGISREDLSAALRLVEARQSARDQVGRSTLPDAARARVLELLEARGTFEGEAVTAAIAAEQAYLAPFSAAGRVSGLGAVSRIETGETRGQKVRAMLEAFFDPAHKDHRHARSPFLAAMAALVRALARLMMSARRDFAVRQRSRRRSASATNRRSRHRHQSESVDCVAAAG